MVAYPIVAPVANNKTRVGWAINVTDSCNDHETRIAAIESLTVRKTANETVTTSTAMQNDDHLKFNMAASGVYVVRMTLDFGSPVAASFKFQVTAPAGCTDVGGRFIYNNTAVGLNGGIIAAGTLWLETGFTTLGAGTHQFIDVSGIFINGGAAGVWQLQWAQNASSGTSTVYSGSFIQYYKTT